MKKLEKFTKQSTQCPSETRSKNINRIKKEKQETDNPIKKEEPKKKS